MYSVIRNQYIYNIISFQRLLLHKIMLSSSPAGEKYSGITIVDQLGTINEIIMGYFQLILTNPYPITNAGCILSEFRRKEST